MNTVESKYRGKKEFLLVYCKLIAAARFRGVVYYEDIGRILGITTTGSHMGKQTGQVLGEISEDEHLVGRPMLSAVAVGRSRYPGPGFFTLARNLEKLHAETDGEERAFWESERDKVYDTWDPLK